MTPLAKPNGPLPRRPDFDEQIRDVWRACRDGRITETVAEKRDLALRIRRGDRIGQGHRP